MKPDDYGQLWAELSTLLFIPLSQGKFAVIDASDWSKVVKHRLHAAFDASSGVWYAGARIPGISRRVPLHRMIMPSAASHIDHVNGDGLDNRFKNLRPATHAQNMANRRGWGRSGWRGVYIQRGGIVGAITASGRRQHLGTFSNPIDAAAAYDLAAVRHHGEFARLNFEHRRPEYEAQLKHESAA